MTDNHFPWKQTCQGFNLEAGHFIVLMFRGKIHQHFNTYWNKIMHHRQTIVVT